MPQAMKKRDSYRLLSGKVSAFYPAGGEEGGEGEVGDRHTGITHDGEQFDF